MSPVKVAQTVCNALSKWEILPTNEPKAKQVRQLGSGRKEDGIHIITIIHMFTTTFPLSNSCIHL